MTTHVKKIRFHFYILNFCSSIIPYHSQHRPRSACSCASCQDWNVPVLQKWMFYYSRERRVRLSGIKEVECTVPADFITAQRILLRAIYHEINTRQSIFCSLPTLRSFGRRGIPVELDKFLSLETEKLETFWTSTYPVLSTFRTKLWRCGRLAGENGFFRNSVSIRWMHCAHSSSGMVVFFVFYSNIGLREQSSSQLLWKCA